MLTEVEPLEVNPTLMARITIPQAPNKVIDLLNLRVATLIIAERVSLHPAAVPVPTWQMMACLQKLKQLHFYRTCFQKRPEFITTTFVQGKDVPLCLRLKLKEMARTSFHMGGSLIKRTSGCDM